MNSKAQYITINGKRAVVLEEAEYLRLVAKDDSTEPPLPAADARGYLPAVEALRVGLARKILRRRRRAGLSQADLARLASVEQSTLSQIEKGKVTPENKTVDKLDRALKKAEQAK